MSVKFSRNDQIFTLTTKNTMYAFKVEGGKYLVHLYYGKKRPSPELKFNPYVVSFSPYRKEFGNTISPDIFAQEMPFFGSGDFRATALRIKNQDGNSVTEFDYVGYKKLAGRYEIPSLPYARADEDTETLEVKLKDKVTGCELYLYYTVYYEEDIITRSIKLVNNSKSDVKLENCMSLCLDLPGCDWEMISLYGGHYDERHFERTPLRHGKQSICSRRGASSPQFNPFMAVCKGNTTEEKGEIYGFNFVFSGCFENIVDVDQMDNTRVLVGLGSENFAYTVESGKSFSSPEAVMTYSAKGIGNMTRNFHHFVNKYIVPENAFDERRPVVLNTWEACYFNIDEEKLVDFAKQSSEVGFDMLVMDDGWFGKRNNDRAGLGDWTPNPEKFKNGLGSFIDRVKTEGKGIKFGIWIEPEMVNPDSDLFRAHPEWCIRCPGRDMSLSREQLVLDMANPDVIQYLKDSFAKAFDGLSIDYIKWDMNRHLSEVGSPYLPADRQDETNYRYVLGVYELCEFFAEHFKGVMIEQCSGGGGRYDLGMMHYCKQIWTSDNTSPYDRTRIQYTSQIAYPASVMSCHVSNSNDNLKSLDYKFKVAVGGVLGYELNILRQSDAAKKVMSEQVALYKQFDRLILTGDYYSVIQPHDDVKYSAYYYINEEKSQILLTFIERKNAKAGKLVNVKVKAADKNATYRDRISGKVFTGESLISGVEFESLGEDDHAEILYLVKE